MKFTEIGGHVKRWVDVNAMESFSKIDYVWCIRKYVLIMRRNRGSSSSSSSSFFFFFLVCGESTEVLTASASYWRFRAEIWPPPLLVRPTFPKGFDLTTMHSTIIWVLPTWKWFNLLQLIAADNFFSVGSVSEPYNHEANGDLSVLNCSQTDTEDDHPILRKEVEAAVQSLKKGKLAGVDNIPAELIQAGGEGVITALTATCNIWQTGEWPTS